MMRSVVVAVALVAAAALAGCGSSDSASASSTTSVPADTGRATTGSTDAKAPTLTDAQVRGVVAKLYPPAPSAKEAAVAGEGCMENMMEGMDMEESTVFTADRAEDGSYERVYGGKNPRTETSKMPFDTAATPKQKADADAFVAKVKAVVKKRGWTDPANVVRDGYRPMQECNSHYINIDAVLDGRDLDPEHPEFIVLEAGHDGKNHFHSVMFMTDSNTGHGPQPFGPLAVWHYHVGGNCLIEGVFNVPQNTATCPKGTEHYDRTPEMLHVSVTGPPFSPAM